MAYQSLTIRPSNGGDLMTHLSSEDVGPANYTIKRDFRRDMDREVRREGDELFAPVSGGSASGSGSELDAGLQPYPNYPDTDEPITLVHLARRPNGKTAVIVGTPTTLYRFFALENGGVYEADVYEPGVFAEVEGVWIVIGSGFSTDGHRWEAENLNGYTVFNNGVDLPVTYRLEEFRVKPLYELRESGIAAVGTIEEFNGFMFYSDISEIDTTELTALLDNITPPTGYTLTQVGTTVTASGGSGAVFTDDMVGYRIYLGTGGYRVISNVLSPTSATIEAGSDFAGVSFTIQNPAAYAAYTDAAHISRIQYRVIWSDLGDPTRLAALGTGSMTAGSHVLSLDYPMRSLHSGQELLVLGAGTDGGNLTATILSIASSGKSLTLDAAASTSVTGAVVGRSDIEGGYVGFQDLQDDSSGILRVSTLQNRVVVFKDTAIFVGTFTGNIDAPFEFTKTYSGSDVPFYRWTVASVDGRELVYAGRNGFHGFDLTRQVPQEHPKLTLCRNIFFDEATPDNQEFIYSAENFITNEVWFLFPSTSADFGLTYCYLHDTCATLGQYYSACATVKRPVSGVQVGPSQDWFVLGTLTGTVLLYGLTDLDAPIYTRQNEPYDSVLQGGRISFGDDFNEKDLRSYLLLLASQSPDTEIEVSISSARSAAETATLRATKIISAPQTRNLVSTYFRALYFQDRIRVTGQTTGLDIAARTFEPAGILSKSAPRQIANS